MKKRKKLSEIQAYFDSPPPPSPQSESQEIEEAELADLEDNPMAEIPVEEEDERQKTDKKEIKAGSLTASLKLPKKTARKIRFTLDLEKNLDERLNRAANKLNRSKAELTRFALKQLLDELESEWSS